MTTQFNSEKFSEDSFVTEVVTLIEKIAGRAIQDKGSFHFSLCGGSTPAAIFHKLSQSPVQMESWHIYWSDERYLKPDDPERNDTLAHDLWLKNGKIPSKNIFSIPFTGNIEEDARSYESLLRNLTFDLSLLGVGEDGHTASLFPENITQDVNELKLAYPIHNSPKPPRERITLSYGKLIESKNILFITKEKGKEEALKVMESLQLSPASYISMRSNSKVFIIKKQEDA